MSFGSRVFSVQCVNARNIQTCKNFYEFISSKLLTIAEKQNLIRFLKNALENSSFTTYFVHQRERKGNVNLLFHLIDCFIV